MQPDYSPKALQLFVHARVRHAGADAALMASANRISGEKAEKRKLRKNSGITVVQFDMAWMGTLRRALPRTRLWSAMDVFPADFGIILTDDGGQMAMAPESDGGS